MSDATVPGSDRRDRIARDVRRAIVGRVEAPRELHGDAAALGHTGGLAIARDHDRRAHEDAPGTVDADLVGDLSIARDLDAIRRRVGEERRPLGGGGRDRASDVAGVITTVDVQAAPAGAGDADHDGRPAGVHRAAERAGAPGGIPAIPGHAAERGPAVDRRDGAVQDGRRLGRRRRRRGRRWRRRRRGCGGGCRARRLDGDLARRRGSATRAGEPRGPEANHQQCDDRDRDPCGTHRVLR